jgi:hypothetical protein
MVEFGCVDLHVWTSRVDRPERPDVVLFDLDPAGVPFADVVRAALLLRAALEALGLDSHPMTTGGDGMHVRVPIARRHGYDEAREFADVVAGALVRTSGGLVTVERSPARRRGVFVDTKMNGHGQQIVAPYSLRPRPQAAVATPLRWDEVDEALDPARLGMAAVLERVEREGDVAGPLLGGRQRLGPALARVAATPRGPLRDACRSSGSTPRRKSRQSWHCTAPRRHNASAIWPPQPRHRRCHSLSSHRVSIAVLPRPRPEVPQGRNPPVALDDAAARRTTARKSRVEYRRVRLARRHDELGTPARVGLAGAVVGAVRAGLCEHE